jgi:predicted signal transduction protein with EAL and GGDEF domain
MAKRILFSRFTHTQRRLVIDIAVIVVAAVAVRAATLHLELFERLYEFSRSHETWELNELFVTLVIMSVALIAFGIRRIQDQRREARLRMASERQVLRLAHYDRLTGLPNRQRFREMVAALSPTSGVYDAILLIDLDGFTPVNDTLGQAAGDHALYTIGQRLKGARSRANDLRARGRGRVRTARGGDRLDRGRRTGRSARAGNGVRSHGDRRGGA